MDKEIDVMRQATYELKIINQNMNTTITSQQNTINNQQAQIDLLKTELCKKDNTYKWCLGGGI